MLKYAARTAGSSGSPRRTPPASVLCTSPGRVAFMTTGKPKSRATFWACSTFVASCVSRSGMP